MLAEIAMKIEYQFVYAHGDLYRILQFRTTTHLRILALDEIYDKVSPLGTIGGSIGVNEVYGQLWLDLR